MPRIAHAVERQRDKTSLYMSSANQGVRRYEIDVSDYLLVARSKLGVIWDVRRAPAHVVAAIAQPTAGHP
jgi:hypothetical protein